MAVQRNDRLANTLSGINIDKRLISWLWAMFRYNLPSANLGEFGSPGMKDRMADLIISEPRFIQYIEQEQPRKYLPDKDIEWITENKRQHTWIEAQLQLRTTETAAYCFPEVPPTLTGRELIIAKIDNWIPKNKPKNIEVSEIASSWELQASADKTFQWFQGEDEHKKCDLAWQILIKNHPYFALLNEQFKNHEELLIFFDTKMPNQAERILFIKTVKARWSQNKYRSKESGKKQQNFILSERAINSLNKLAEKHDLRRAEILEILLKMEDEKGAYLAENLHSKIKI